jgi:hypothetical protein
MTKQEFESQSKKNSILRSLPPPPSSDPDFAPVILPDYLTSDPERQAIHTFALTRLLLRAIVELDDLGRISPAQKLDLKDRVIVQDQGLLAIAADYEDDGDQERLRARLCEEAM